MPSHEQISNLPQDTPTEIDGQWFYRRCDAIWVLRVTDMAHGPALSGGKKPVWAHWGNCFQGQTDKFDPEICNHQAAVETDDGWYCPGCESVVNLEGTEGQDRESYDDDQDRESYEVDPNQEDDNRLPGRWDQRLDR